MKNKKILLILSLAMLGGVGAHMAMDNTTMNAEAAASTITIYNGESTLPADGTTYSLGNNAELTLHTKSITYGEKDSNYGMYYSGASNSRYISFVVPTGYNLTSIKTNIYINGGRTSGVGFVSSAPSKSIGDAIPENNQAGLIASKKGFHDNLEWLSQPVGEGTYYLCALGSLVIQKLDVVVSQSTFSVYFKDGNTSCESLTQNVEPGKFVSTDPSYEYTLPSKEGLKFAGWSTTEGGAVVDLSTYAINADTTFYAVWEAVTTHTVTFDSNGGSDVAPATVNNGESVSEPEMPVHPEGYAFVEWQLGGVKYDFTNPVTENITLVANWAAPIYSESVQIDQASFEWAKAELDTPKQLTATVDTKGDTVNTYPEVTWSSSDTNVVTVDSTGKISTVGNKGEATITAKIYEGTSHEQSSSIVVKVGYTKLDTDLSKNLYFNCVTESEAHYPDATGKESAIVDLDGQTFGGFTIHSMNSTDNDTKWSGTGSNKGRSLMTNADISFVAKKKGTLTFEFATTKDSRTIILDGITYAMDAKDTYKTVVVENVAPGEHTLQLGLSQNSSDNKIWFKYLKFEETKETKWIDTDVHLAYQVGKSSAEVTKIDSVRFIGFVKKEALDFLKNTWFVVKLDGQRGETPFSKEVTTTPSTTVYSSVEYYDETGAIKQFTPSVGVVEDYYYFAVSFKNIPSDFVGSITATAYAHDTNDVVYQTAASAVVNLQ